MSREMDRVQKILQVLRSKSDLEYEDLIELKSILTDYMVLLYQTEKPNGSIN